MDDDLLSLLPRTDLTRRGFVVTTLAAGFALAVQPVSAETITTDAKGLEAGEVKIPVLDGQIPAYRAMPAKGGPFPAVLVIQEIFGVHEHIKDVCRRLAKLGYYAIAPEMYARQGDVSKITAIPEIISKVVSKVPDSQVMSDLDAAVAYMKKTGKVDPLKLAITGFCWGGRVVWLYSAHNPDIKAGVAWYGALVRPSTPNNPKQPIDVVADLKAPILGLYGARDNGIPLDTVEKMRVAMKAAGKPGEIIVYPEAGHGFHADYRESYSPKEAQDGWMRLLEFFKKNGVA